MGVEDCGADAPRVADTPLVLDEAVTDEETASAAACKGDCVTIDDDKDDSAVTEAVEGDTATSDSTGSRVPIDASSVGVMVESCIVSEACYPVSNAVLTLSCLLARSLGWLLKYLSTSTGCSGVSESRKEQSTSDLRLTTLHR